MKTLALPVWARSVLLLRQRCIDLALFWTCAAAGLHPSVVAGGGPRQRGGDGPRGANVPGSPGWHREVRRCGGWAARFPATPTPDGWRVANPGGSSSSAWLTDSSLSARTGRPNCWSWPWMAWRRPPRWRSSAAAASTARTSSGRGGRWRPWCGVRWRRSSAPTPAPLPSPPCPRSTASGVCLSVYV